MRFYSKLVSRCFWCQYFFCQNSRTQNDCFEKVDEFYDLWPFYSKFLFVDFRGRRSCLFMVRFYSILVLKDFWVSDDYFLSKFKNLVIYGLILFKTGFLWSEVRIFESKFKNSGRRVDIFEIESEMGYLRCGGIY